MKQRGRVQATQESHTLRHVGSNPTPATMNCYIENVFKAIDRNLKHVALDDGIDKQEFLDAVAARVEKRRTTEPRSSSKTRHGAGRSK